MKKIKNRKNLQAMGGRVERQARDILINQGYLVIKSGGSKGIFDLWAINDKELRLIQIKKFAYSHQSRNLRNLLLNKFHKEIEEIKKLNVIGNKELWVKTKQGWFIEKI